MPKPVKNFAEHISGVLFLCKCQQLARKYLVLSSHSNTTNRSRGSRERSPLAEHSEKVFLDEIDKRSIVPHEGSYLRTKSNVVEMLRGTCNGGHLDNKVVCFNILSALVSRCLKRRTVRNHQTLMLFLV